MTTNYYIASGFQADCKTLINRFEECDSIRFQDFSNIWQEMKFSAIFTGRQSYAEMLEFCEEVLQVAKLFILPPYRFKTQIGGLYLLYGIYYKLPCDNVKIRVTLSDWKEILELHNNIRDENHTDANYILSKMIYDDVFNHCAFHREYGLERFLRVKEKQPVNHYSLLPTVKDMSEPGQLLSKVENMSKMYHQAKCRISESSQPKRALNMYDSNIAETLINEIKNFDNQRQNLPNNSNEDNKETYKKHMRRDSEGKGFQLRSFSDKARPKLGHGFDTDSSDEEVLDINQLEDYNPNLPDRFDQSSDSSS